MKELLYVARDKFGYIIDFAETLLDLAGRFNMKKHTIAWYVSRGEFLRSYSCYFEKYDFSTDLSPNSFEDYIEFCKFEKIKPSHSSSLQKYRDSVAKYGG